MKNKKILYILTLIVVCGLMISPIMASSQTEDTTTLADASLTSYYNLAAVHPSGTSSISVVAASFAANQEGYLTNVTIQVMKLGSPTAILRCRVTGCTSWSTGPNATVFATSDSIIDTADLVLSTRTNITFQFDQTYQFNGSGPYNFYVYVESATLISASNYVRVYYGTAIGHASYRRTYYSSGWTSGSSNDVGFLVLSDTAAAGNSTGPAEDDDSGDWSDVDTVTTAFVDFIVPTSVVLTPAFLLFLILGRGKWPFLIGITIGVGLGYYYGLVPIWIVFLVTIGIVGMAYQSVRGGGSE